jgi:glycosyltransferase involved in cell wall biosynthesis
MKHKSAEWVCCQFGARENYAISRSLHLMGVPTDLVTDLWFPYRFLHFPWGKELRKRYHPDLQNASIKSFNVSMIASRIFHRIIGNRVDSVENIFIDKVVKWIQRNYATSPPKVLFSYSYTANEIFKTGKNLGCINLLGQINPGPEEAKIVEEAFQAEFGKQYPTPVPSPEYWQNWEEEISLADRIVVNSSWSESLLIKAGVASEKLRVIPLAFEPNPIPNNRKIFPRQFSKDRPFRLLYLGSISVRKGFHLLRKAMTDLIHAPVILDVVGSLIGPEELLKNLPPNIQLHGRKNLQEKDTFYQHADAFILPTLSDGFAITQLEAQSWKLPLIVSDRCGEVVKQDLNGIILDNVIKESIVQVLLFLINHPEKLEAYSDHSIDLHTYSLRSVGEKWLKAVE